MPRSAFTTHAYADSKLFEQSLDVYYPAELVSPAVPPPLVVLVVGSGWLGHRSIIYNCFNRENAAGPRAIAALGCVCVAVRHRGAFIQPPNTTLTALIAPVTLMLWGFAGFLLLALLCIAWTLVARGAATHEDMVDDVARALVWVRSRRSRLTHCDDATDQPACHQQGAAEIVGGYSSGGHVLISLLARRDKLKQWGLPIEGAGFDGVLLISGVCATLPGPPLANYIPAWLAARAVTAGVFGLFADPLRGEPARVLPSPVHSVESCTRIPHLLVHCVHEAFGVPIWELALTACMLSTKELAAALRRVGIAVRVESIASNHWKILGSPALREALRVALLEDGWPRSLPSHRRPRARRAARHVARARR